jgi:hypothetical protein
MAPTNDFLPFCETFTGTNLLTQPDYITDGQRPIGNQPGVARSKLVNKALRQSTYIAAALAQYLSDSTGDNVLDDATPANVIATMVAAFRKPPTVQVFLAGAGTYTTPTGRVPAYLRIRMAGGGGGGGAGQTQSMAATAGGVSTFGTALLTANGGAAGALGASPTAGGASTVSAPATKLMALTGGSGGGVGYGATLYPMPGATGGSNPLGGAGGADSSPSGSSANVNASANTGGGGGGAGTTGSGIPVGNVTGSGGGAGGYLEAIITGTLAATYAYACGAGGVGATGSINGGNGGSGIIIVEEFYQ